jgi:hypothetical protein
MRARHPKDHPGNVAAHRWDKRFLNANGQIDPVKMGLEINDAQQRCLEICEHLGEYAKADITGEMDFSRRSNTSKPLGRCSARSTSTPPAADILHLSNSPTSKAYQ